MEILLEYNGWQLIRTGDNYLIAKQFINERLPRYMSLSYIPQQAVDIFEFNVMKEIVQTFDRLQRILQNNPGIVNYIR